MKKLLLLTTFGLLTASAAFSQIYDNGPVFNSTGTGAGGADESILYTTTFSMGTIGFGQQSSAYNRIADEFTVDCSWKIDSIFLYGYQTNSTTTSTFTNYNLRIWNGAPNVVGSVIVYGDTVTNRLIRSVFSGVYRVTETTSGNNARPIMQNTISVDTTLPAGTYYLDWSAAGSLASGPWQPPVVFPLQASSGNGLQRTAGVWNNMVDGGTGTTPQGAPFKIWGTAATLTADAGSVTEICENTSFQLGGAPTGTSNVGSPLTFAWQGAGISDTTLSNPDASISTPTQFIVIVSDTNGCSAVDTINVNTIALPSLSIPTDLSICSGDSVELIGNSNYPVYWNDTLSNGTFVTPTTTSSYVAVATSGVDCSTTSTLTITVNEATAGSTSISGMDSVEINGITYYQDGVFTQTLTNANGCDSILTITVSLDFTSINEFTSNFSISPNPTSDVIYIKSDAGKNTKYVISNLEGKTILFFETTNDNYLVDVSKLRSGSYILKNIESNQTQLLIKK